MTEGKRSFLSGTTGVLGAITAFVTAVGGLIAILIQVGVIGGGGNSSKAAAGGPPTASVGARWSDDANDACARANDLITGLPSPKTLTPQAALAMGRQALRINVQLVRELAKIPKPAPQQTKIDAFLRLGAGINESWEEMLADFSSGNLVDVQHRQQTLSTLGQKFDRAAIDLGATTCAEGASFSGGLPGG